MEDRRGFPRLDITVKVKWEKIAYKSDLVVENVGEFKNISALGICLTMNEKKVETGDVLYVTFVLPTKKTIFADGRVLWVKEYQVYTPVKEIKYDVGVKFLEITTSEKEEINKFVLTFDK